MRRLLKRILSYYPTAMPITMTQFNTWLDSILELAGPIADKDSLEWVISNEIMRLAPGRDRVPKHLFVKLLRKYAANQFAANKVLELKLKQEEANRAAQAEALRQQAEATAQLSVALDENPKTEL